MIIYDYDDIEKCCDHIRFKKLDIVFTNGAFDLFHFGHLGLIKQCKIKLNQSLIIGINSDESVKQLKGGSRPIISDNHRAAIVHSLEYVDHVIVFDELTPNTIIGLINPNIIVKGGDWNKQDIINMCDQMKCSDSVEARIIKLIPTESTSKIIKRIKELDFEPSDNDKIRKMISN